MWVTGCRVALSTIPSSPASRSLKKNGDVAARQPSESPQRGTNRVVLASGNIWRGSELARWPAFGHNAPHGDFEMPALISGNCADVGTVNEYGNGRSVGSADAIGACDVPLLNLIGDLGEPVDNGPMIVWSRSGHKEIEHTSGFSKR